MAFVLSFLCVVKHVAYHIKEIIMAKDIKEAGSLAAAMVAVQIAAGGVVGKNANNPFTKKQYADLQAYLEVILPPLLENNCYLTAETQLGTNVLMVKTIIRHIGGESIEISIPMPLSSNPTPQDIGSAMTYGRRYGIAALFGLAQGDDDGSSLSGKIKLEEIQAKQRPRPQAPTQQAVQTKGNANLAGWLKRLEVPGVNYEQAKSLAKNVFTGEDLKTFLDAANAAQEAAKAS